MWPIGAHCSGLSEENLHQTQEEFILGAPAAVGQTAVGESCKSPLLKVTDVLGESPVVKPRFNGVQLVCLVDSGSKVKTIAKAMFETYFLTTYSLTTVVQCG